MGGSMLTMPTGMERTNQTEILDKPGVPQHVSERAYAELARLHRFLGDTRFIEKAIRRDPFPVRRVLDLGCATGVVLHELCSALGIEGTGVDVAPVRNHSARFPIVRADAVRDELPAADVAYSMCLGHHLREDEIVAMIRNVGRYCRRFILLDLVRHPLPLALFRFFVAPFASPVVVKDGITSIRRSYTGPEMQRLAAQAVSGSGATFQHSVTPFYTRQVIDISYL